MGAYVSRVDIRLNGRRYYSPGGATMIVLGVILLILGWLTGLSILYTIGAILLVIGVVLLVLGSAGRAVGGRRHYW
jgi:uncharacterized membrane protein HdeD (DUF308 family)